MANYHYQVPENLVRSLKFFDGCDAATCEACCKVAADFLRTGINAKMYTPAANRLNTTVAKLRTATEALMLLLTDASKHQLSTDAVSTALSESSLERNLCVALSAVYADIGEHLVATLNSMVPRLLPEYSGVQWRIDVEFASRALFHFCKPSITLQLKVKTSDGCENQLLLSIDAAALKRLVAELERALATLRSREYRKLMNRV
uniref:COMM domain-containing protein n=1 Tax=Plectus sambesii TaxID=2011161 RepID=A0A914V7P3_9BILA